jgi:hypothetical protein
VAENSKALQAIPGRHRRRNVGVSLLVVIATIVAVLAPVFPAGPVNLYLAPVGGGRIVDVGHVSESLTYVVLHCGMVYYQFTGAYQGVSTMKWYCG